MDSEIPSSQPNVSPADVEGLLAQAGGAQPKAAESPARQSNAPSSSKSPRSVFRQLSSVSSGDLRKLKLRQEHFIHTLSSRLAIHLRMEIGVRMSRLETMPYKKFVGSLSNPTHLVLLKLEPLHGLCLLDIPPQLALSIIDRELGGKGECSEAERGLTEIEVRILSKVLHITTSEWCGSWSDMIDLRAAQIGYESSSAYVQGFPMDTPMLVVGVELQIGELTRQMHFGIPYASVEMFIKKLNASGPGVEEPAEKKPSSGPKWNPALDDVNLRVSAKLPNLKITAREVASLKSGDVIPLDPEILQHLRVSLAQKPKFLATMGRCGPRWAAKITKVIEG